MDKALIEQLHDAWLAAEREGRINDILELCTEDVVVQPPIAPACVGRQDFRRMLEGSAGAIADIRISDLTIDVFEGVAIKRARFSTLLADSGGPIEGAHLWILRPRWKVCYLSWSLDRPPE